MPIASLDDYIAANIDFSGGGCWHKLADAAGSTTAADSSGNGNTATEHGTVTFGEASLIPGTEGSCALFSADSCLATAWKPTLSAVLVAVAFDYVPTGSAQFLCGDGGTSSDVLGVTLSVTTANGLEVDLFNGSTSLVATIATIAAGVHVCLLVWDGTNVWAVLDGTYYALGAFSGEIVGAHVNWSIGGSSSASSWAGEIQEHLVVPYALTESEAEALCAAYMSYWCSASFSLTAQLGADAVCRPLGGPVTVTAPAIVTTLEAPAI